MDDNRTEFHFKGFGDAERADVEAEIRAALADVKGGRYDDELKRAGIARADIAETEDMPYEMEGGQHLAGPEWVLIYIIARAGTRVGTKALIDVWTRIILPRLEHRYSSSRVRKEPPPKE